MTRRQVFVPDLLEVHTASEQIRTEERMQRKLYKDIQALHVSFCFDILWSQAHGTPMSEICHIEPGFPSLCAIRVWESQDHLKAHLIWFLSFCNHIPEIPTVTKSENSCFLSSVKLSSYLKRNSMSHEWFQAARNRCLAHCI